MEYKSKVYINPDFIRKIPTDTESSEYPKTTYVNRHFPLDLSKIQTYQAPADAGRKIYVNPNFLGHNKNLAIFNTPYDFLINQSNSLDINHVPTYTYSQVNNMQNEHLWDYRISPNDNFNYSSTSALQNTEVNDFKPQQIQVVHPINFVSEEPLTKSRYSIVRKPNTMRNETQVFSDNNANDNMPCSLSGCPAANTVSSCNCQKQNSTSRTTQVTKMKVSKYKTIPISSYLQSNTQTMYSGDMKPTTSALYEPSEVEEEYERFNASSALDVYNKSCYKYVKSRTPPSSPVDDSYKTDLLKLKRNLPLSKLKMNLQKGKFKVNNIPCRLYTKYGKCLRKDYGKCQFLHDKKHVSLCRKFLKGICHDDECPLSHEVTTKKMPTCYFYLLGMCTKQLCPYLHIKLSDKTKICQEFAKGYCEKGEDCSFRHIKNREMKNRKKSKVNYNRKTHQIKPIKATKVLGIEETIDEIMADEPTDKKPEVQERSECRYYEEAMEDESNLELIKPKRCKLGDLPSFIQF